MNQRNPKCCLIVLNCNGKDLLRPCLDSVSRQTYADFETLVVDNGSTDGSVEMLAGEYQWARIIALQENCGFCIANNVAIRDALARDVGYVMLLNNDTTIAPDCIAKMMAAMEADGRIAAVCPKIYFADHPDTLWYAGGDFSLWTAKARMRGWKRKDEGQWDGIQQVTCLTGCALLVRSSVLRKVGLLDEQFWAYLEDVDWSIRFLRAGYKMAFAPAAHVWHCDGGTLVRSMSRGSQQVRQFLSTRNMVLIARKHVRWWQMPTYVAGFLLTHVAFFTALRIARKDVKALSAIYQGFLSGLRETEPGAVVKKQVPGLPAS
jgi:GT2 family glycosyltransferase